MAAVVVATRPPVPMFSAAKVNVTPWFLIRSPNAGSFGHWWESPQPAAMTRLCLCALATRPDVMVSGACPASARHALIWASNCWATSGWLGNCAGVGGGAAGGGGTGVGGGVVGGPGPGVGLGGGAPAGPAASVASAEWCGPTDPAASPAGALPQPASPSSATP